MEISLTRRLMALFLGALILAWGAWLAVAQSNAVPAGVRALQADGIQNFYQLSPRIYSGSAPEGEAGFAALQKLGVKTIITVDGAPPDVAGARRFGMRYVHLPIGYDGVPGGQALRLVKAAETLPGPVFVHCHHGLHRGPAGAAVICRAMEGWTVEQAEAWLKLAGTATNYGGLYRTVAEFQPPSAETLAGVSADFPEKSKISALADVMVEIDGRFDHLKLIRKSGFKTPQSHPDLDPAQETLLLRELFRELARSPMIDKKGADFREKLATAEGAAAALEADMTHAVMDARKAETSFWKLDAACSSCHAAHRN